MRRLSTPFEAQRWCADERADAQTIGFVPTMGALHEGHLALVRRAVSECSRVVVSIFVNPLQFDDPRDLERYPRDFDRDAERLAEVGCAMVFRGTLKEFFPECGGGPVPLRSPGHFAEGLEGACRAGHFAGVATIVERLFDVVEPTRAYFGAKDFQQSLVVRDLARERGAPEVVVCTTVREHDGLALSSRNEQLDAAARERALCLSRGLHAARAAWRAGEREVVALCARMRAEFELPGVELEYAAVRDPEQWSEDTPSTLGGAARALVAARVGGVRLIDNLALEADEERVER